MRGPGFITVTKLATCKYCGQGQLAWAKSKSGKWFLCEAFIIEGEREMFEANKFQPHRCGEKKAI